MIYRQVLRHRRFLAWCCLILFAVSILIFFSKYQSRKRIKFIIDSPFEPLYKRRSRQRAGTTNTRPGLDVNHKDTIIITAEQSEAEIENNFFKYLENKDIICKNDRRMGDQHDGGWNVCLSPPFELKKPCLVYSFGIGGDWRFEDEISDYYGCQVLAFDPSIPLLEHNRTELIHYKPIGLGGEERITAKKWKLKRFLTHLIDGGHTQSIIDYLKFDIEYEEWYALQTMVIDGALKNVKQMGFEMHMKHPQDTRPGDLEVKKEDFLRMYELLKLLEGMNFKKFNYRLNPFCNYASNITKLVRSRCYELHYMNMRFVKIHHMKGLDTKVGMLNR